MIAFYSDETLTHRLDMNRPKRFLLPLSGGDVNLGRSVLYLADPWTAMVMAGASAPTSLSLDQTGEFDSAGSAQRLDGAGALLETFTYTGKTGATLTGVSGLTAVVVGDRIRPYRTWWSHGNLRVYTSGASIQDGLLVSLSSTVEMQFPGTPARFAFDHIDPGQVVAVYLQVGLAPSEQEQLLNNWQLQSSALYPRTTGTTFTYSATEGGMAATVPGWVRQCDSSLHLHLRLLPGNRQVRSNLPGLIIGQYRWRDQDSINATALVPTQWDADLPAIGAEKFTTGYADRDDLALVDIEEVPEGMVAIAPRVERGFYWDGYQDFYLAADPELLFVASHPGQLSYPLPSKPQRLLPLFVGTWQRNSYGFYSKAVEYRYQAAGLDAGNPEPQFTLDQDRRQLTVNQPLTGGIMPLGTLSGEANDYFTFPVHPVARVNRVFIDRGSNVPPLSASLSDCRIDYDQGKLTISRISGPSIVGGLAGESVCMEYEPALAVLYEISPDSTRLLDLELNPAYSGVSSGHVYVQHRRIEPARIELVADKPLIRIPATHANYIGLEAYGPIWFEQDYALLTATAYSAVPGEPVPGAMLDVEILEPDSWTGTLNYKDPLAEQIRVRTGSDGAANLIYVPRSKYGLYVPTAATSGRLAGVATTTIANDSLVLPDIEQAVGGDKPGVDIDQLYNSDEGWLVATYKVLNNDPIMGIVDGDASLGEVPWSTVGTPGASDYRTNGERSVWALGTALMRPLDARDDQGRSYANPSFSGVVKTLVFPAALPTENVGAYFVTYVQRVALRLRLRDSNIVSNLVLLEMQPPLLISENPWLILGAQPLGQVIQGYLNQYRLGWVRTVPKP